MRLTAPIALVLVLWAGCGGGLRAATPGGPAPALRVTDASTRAEDLLAPDAAAGFTPFGRWTPSLGFLREDQAAWVRIELPGDPARDVTRVVDLGITRLLHADWHVVADGKVTAIRRSGAADVAPPERVAQRKPWVKVDIPRGESRTVLLRVASDTAVWLPLRVGTEAEHRGWTLSRAMVDFTVFGACVGIGVLNLLMGGITRNRIYLVAGALPLAHLAYQGVFLGYHQAVFPDLPRWVSKEGMLLFSTVLGMGLFAFTHQLLRQPEARERRFTLLAILAGGTTVPVILLTPFPVGSQLANLLLVGGGALCAWAAATGLRKGSGAEDWLLLAGWMLPLASGLVLLAQLGGHVPLWFNPTVVIRIILPGTFILFVLAALRSQRRLREAELNLEGARRLREAAQLEALRHQLNPHLAFNTLASIEALSREAPERIPALVNRLASFLRHRMAPSGRTFQSLGEELDSARAYLDIEAAHLGERLQVDIRVEPGSSGLPVPEFSLQPLVENAVKHGLAESDRVRIRIEAEVEGGRLRVRVANTGRIRPPRPSPRGEGIGLGNLRNRLALHLGDDARVTLREADGWVTAEMDIPARTGHPSP